RARLALAALEGFLDSLDVDRRNAHGKLLKPGLTKEKDRGGGPTTARSQIPTNSEASPGVGRGPCVRLDFLAFRFRLRVQRQRCADGRSSAWTARRVLLMPPIEHTPKSIWTHPGWVCRRPSTTRAGATRQYRTGR